MGWSMDPITPSSSIYFGPSRRSERPPPNPPPIFLLPRPAFWGSKGSSKVDVWWFGLDSLDASPGASTTQAASDSSWKMYGNVEGGAKLTYSGPLGGKALSFQSTNEDKQFVKLEKSVYFKTSEFSVCGWVKHRTGSGTRGNKRTIFDFGNANATDSIHVAAIPPTTAGTSEDAPAEDLYVNLRDIYGKENSVRYPGFWSDSEGKWMHFCISVDTFASNTETTRLRVFKDGRAITECTTIVGAIKCKDGGQLPMSATGVLRITRGMRGTSYIGTSLNTAFTEFDGWMSDFVLLDGTAVECSCQAQNLRVGISEMPSSTCSYSTCKVFSIGKDRSWLLELDSLGKKRDGASMPIIGPSAGTDRKLWVGIIHNGQMGGAYDETRFDVVSDDGFAALRGYNAPPVLSFTNHFINQGTGKKRMFPSPGSKAYVGINDGGGTVVGGRALSICGWIKPTMDDTFEVSTPQAQYLSASLVHFGNTDTGSDNIRVVLLKLGSGSTNNMIQLQIDENNGRYYNGYNQIRFYNGWTPGKWSHFCVSVDDTGDYRAFRDGNPLPCKIHNPWMATSYVRPGVNQAKCEGTIGRGGRIPTRAYRDGAAIGSSVSTLGMMSNWRAPDYYDGSIASLHVLDGGAVVDAERARPVKCLVQTPQPTSQ